jgi:predicted dinucleotide-binding enzyme
MIGAGNIGGTLGGHWARAGHEIVFAVRRPKMLGGLIAGLDGNARTGTFAEAAAFGAVLAFAAPYGYWPEFAREYRSVLAGKVVIDCANPDSERDGRIAVDAIAVGAGAYTASLLPGAHVVKAFNTIFWQDLRDEAYRTPPRLAIPVVGDDSKALAIVARLIDDAGFDVVPAGGLSSSRRVDPGAAVYAKSLDAKKLAALLAREQRLRGETSRV